MCLHHLHVALRGNRAWWALLENGSDFGEVLGCWLWGLAASFLVFQILLRVYA